MENSIIGEQISKFRRKAGMTQEELGKAVGVSTQAVSRWECGGAPDITLIPGIADRLGVSIDALFGRETGEYLDMAEVMRKWLRSLPKEQMFQELTEKVWSSLLQFMTGDALIQLPYPDSSFVLDKYPGAICNSVFESDHGFYFAAVGRDFSYTTLCPRPEKGYQAYLQDPEESRKFLRLLARPGCLEILYHLLSQQENYYTVDMLAQGVGMPEEQVLEILRELAQTGMVQSKDLGTLRGKEKIYSSISFRSCGFLILCYLVRNLGQSEKINFAWCNTREKPLLEERESERRNGKCGTI